MSEIVAAFGLRRDGQWDVEHLDGRKEVVCSREMDRRGITVQNSGEVKMLQERVTAAEKRAEELEKASRCTCCGGHVQNPHCDECISNELPAYVMEAEKRAEEAEAQAGAMREAQEAVEWPLWHDARMDWYCAACKRLKKEGHAPDCVVGVALASNAGRSVQERMAKLEKVAMAVHSLDQQCSVTECRPLCDPDGPHHNLCGTDDCPAVELKQAMGALKALAALEAKL